MEGRTTSNISERAKYAGSGGQNVPCCEGRICRIEHKCEEHTPDNTGDGFLILCFLRMSGLMQCKYI